MKKPLIITIAVLFSILTANAQNLFIIGEKSYPCTEAMKLESNSDDHDDDDRYDLELFIAKGGNSGAVAVSTRSIYGSAFTGKLNIYLEDGSVLICNDSYASEQVDDRALALYYLTNEQLNALQQNNIHTVKYTIELIGEQKYSASNPGINTSVIISEFFNPTGKSSNIDETNNSPDEPPPLLEEPVEEKPFAYVEQMPTFPDGQEAMYIYIYSSIEYPEKAKQNGISGHIIVQFVVSKDGSIRDAKVVRGIGGGCNEEALRVVNSMPKWNPGMHNGRYVPVTFTLPIKFVLP